MAPHLHAFLAGFTDHCVHFEHRISSVGVTRIAFALVSWRCFCGGTVGSMAASRDGCCAMAGCGVVLAFQCCTNSDGLVADDRSLDRDHIGGSHFVAGIFPFVWCRNWREGQTAAWLRWRHRGISHGDLLCWPACGTAWRSWRTDAKSSLRG